MAVYQPAIFDVQTGEYGCAVRWDVCKFSDTGGVLMGEDIPHQSAGGHNLTSACAYIGVTRDVPTSAQQVCLTAPQEQE